MATRYVCERCQNEVPPSKDRCPTCNEPAPAPNVRAAQDPDEVEALEKRYSAAVENAAGRGCAATLQAFERAMQDSVAVVARPLRELLRLTEGDNQLYASYYALLDVGLKVPDGKEWDVVREAVDSALFPGYRDNIRFGALSLGGEGVQSYGDCFLVLRTDFIAHRASVFDQNSVVFTREHDIRLAESNQLPLGFRARWADRAKLAVAKLAVNLDQNTVPKEFPSILCRQGVEPAGAEFIEVHLWGPFTINTVQRAILLGGREKLTSAMLRRLEQGLAKSETALEIRR